MSDNSALTLQVNNMELTHVLFKELMQHTCSLFLNCSFKSDHFV